jgi:predicted SAM-dependent methyltransferase
LQGRPAARLRIGYHGAHQPDVNQGDLSMPNPNSQADGGRGKRSSVIRTIICRLRDMRGGRTTRTGRSDEPAALERAALSSPGARRGPDHPGGIKRVHVGCGPHGRMESWWNVDIRGFSGIDQLLDATLPWPYHDVDYIFGEHFIEHLTIDRAIDFLTHAGDALKTGGRLRLSTPNLEWVLRTHYPASVEKQEEHVSAALMMNRAFYGWGHRFLYSREMLRFVLTEVGFENVAFFSYGESADPNLRHLERHGDFDVCDGHPSVIIAEAEKGSRLIRPTPRLMSLLDEQFLRHVASGH